MPDQRLRLDLSQPSHGLAGPRWTETPLSDAWRTLTCGNGIPSTSRTCGRRLGDKVVARRWGAAARSFASRRSDSADASRSAVIRPGASSLQRPYI